MAELGTVEMADLAKITKPPAVPKPTGEGPRATTPLITAYRMEVSTGIMKMDGGDRTRVHKARRDLMENIVIVKAVGRLRLE